MQYIPNRGTAFTLNQAEEYHRSRGVSYSKTRPYHSTGNS